MKRHLKFIIIKNCMFFLFPFLAFEEGLAKDKDNDTTFREAIKHFVPMQTFETYTGKKIHLSDVIKSVGKHYPEILIAEKEVSIAQSDILASQGSFDFKWNTYGTSNPLGYYVNDRVNTVVEKPTPYQGVSVFAGYRIGNGDFPVYEGKHFTSPLGEARAGVKIPLWRGREIDESRVKLDQAKLGKGRAYSHYESEKIRIYKTATQKYWEWVAAGRQYVIIKNLLQLAKNRVIQIQGRLDAGDIPLIEKNENDRAILEREVYLIEAERYLQKTSLALALYYRNKNGNMYLPTPSQIPEQFPEVEEVSPKTLKEDVSKAWKKRPEMSVLELEKRKIRLDLELQKNHLTPQVDLVVVGSQNMGKKRSQLDKYVDKEIAKLNSTTTDNKDLIDRLLKPQVEVTVVLSVPIQARKQKGKIGSLSGKLSQLNQKSNLMHDKIRIEVQDAYSELENAKKEVIVAKKEAILAKKLEEMERERFTLGESNLLIVNIREQKTAEAAAKYIKSLAMRNIAYSFYLAATGELLDKIP
ncbi:MAG: TolC family protein [Leptospiraceae bacterium]|nr:TolC family protein [Leptospiraceae bacterium]MCP5497142.1 TolC family protein [Leptospiraceae bacterium]